MKTTEAGKLAEARVASELKSKGYKIIAQNWRTPICEIDIIASKDKVVYFVEVKYRSSDSQGEGLDYITPKKLKQMRFAAEIWNQQSGWEGDFRLLAAAVSEGKDIELVEV